MLLLLLLFFVVVVRIFTRHFRSFSFYEVSIQRRHSIHELESIEKIVHYVSLVINSVRDVIDISPFLVSVMVRFVAFFSRQTSCYVASKKLALTFHSRQLACI